MQAEVSKNGTVRSVDWDAEWWRAVQLCEPDAAICGAKVQTGTLPIKYGPCLKEPGRFDRCAQHQGVDKLYSDELFASGLNGLKVCGGCNKCELSGRFDSRRIKPFCYKEYEIYTGQIKELLSELDANKIEVRQYIRIAIQAVAMIIVQMMRCDQELALGNMVIIEKQVFKSRDNERTIETPKENPAVVMKTKLLKSLGELAKTLMISPREKAEDKTKGDKPKSAAEFMMDVVNRAGGIEGGTVAPRS